MSYEFFCPVLDFPFYSVKYIETGAKKKSILTSTSSSSISNCNAASKALACMMSWITLIFCPISFSFSGKRRTKPPLMASIFELRKLSQVSVYLSLLFIELKIRTSQLFTNSEFSNRCCHNLSWLRYHWDMTETLSLNRSTVYSQLNEWRKSFSVQKDLDTSNLWWWEYYQNRASTILTFRTAQWKLLV